MIGILWGLATIGAYLMVNELIKKIKKDNENK
jgi:hypothetical protein